MGPEPQTKDKYFGFLPGNGIHDIHMNQGNTGRFVDDDGVYQDGGLLVQFADQHEWVAIFLKFQSQAWHTDDRTGHSIAEPPCLFPRCRLARRCLRPRRPPMSRMDCAHRRGARESGPVAGG